MKEWPVTSLPLRYDSVNNLLSAAEEKDVENNDVAGQQKSDTLHSEFLDSDSHSDQQAWCLPPLAQTSGRWPKTPPICLCDQHTFNEDLMQYKVNEKR